MESRKFNPFRVFHKYNASILNGYSVENVIADARLIVRNFTPAQNDERALYQLSKLAGIANSLDFIISARVHLQAGFICEDEDIYDLIRLQSKLTDIILELYFSTPTLYCDTRYASRMLELKYIR